jgi:hypothetical protein
LQKENRVPKDDDPRSGNPLEEEIDPHSVEVIYWNITKSPKKCAGTELCSDEAFSAATVQRPVHNDFRRNNNTKESVRAVNQIKTFTAPCISAVYL